jgi:probable F420-dependent oxidoreductase
MKITLSIPVSGADPSAFQSMEALRQIASALERAGIHACHLTDHPAPSATWLHAHGHDALDPFTTFGALAALTTTLKFFTNILVLPYRNPFLTAKSAATLQVISGGRLILGTGGGYQKAEFDALGVSFEERGTLFDEALDVIRLAWRGGPVNYQGRHFTAVDNEPRPVPRPAPPIWIGGASEKALERAARSGDGWCPFFAKPTLSKTNRDTGIQSTPHLREMVDRLHAMRDKQGRTGAFDVTTELPRMPAFGTSSAAREIVDGLEALAGAGATWTMIQPPRGSRTQYLECVEWFGAEVLTKLREAA